jgi:hypothetical protein
VAKLLYFEVIVLDIVLYRKAGGVVDADVATEPKEDPGLFERD